MDGSLGHHVRTGSVRYSLVIPIFNEEDTLPTLIERLTALIDSLDAPAEVVFVNDGSRDDSYDLMVRANRADPRIKLINLSRNFGHQIAITAGMDFARGDAVIVMDADLQDPPEVVPDLIARWKEGYDVVYAVRGERQGETRFKRLTAHWFYRVIQLLSSVHIPSDAGDFRLVDRRALDVLGTMRERDRFVRGMFSWMGLKQIGVPYVRHSRDAGKSKYPIGRMLSLAVSGIVGFSDAPLRLAIWLGALISFGAMAYGVYIFALSIGGAQLVPGWTSTIVFLSLLGGVNLIMTGITGIYVGRIHEEVKNRPLYVVDDIQGISDTASPRGAHIARRASMEAAVEPAADRASEEGADAR